MGLAIRKVLARRTNGAKSCGFQTAIQVLIAAGEPAAEMDFQSVEMADMRLSTASLQRSRFSWPSCELAGERS